MKLSIPLIASFIFSTGKTSAFLNSGPVESNLLQPSFDDVRTNFYFTRLFDCTDPQAIADWSCKACKKLPGVTYLTSFKDDFTNTQAYVALNNTSGHIITVFRGTNGVVQQLLDLTFIPLMLIKAKSPPFLKVHLGFLTALNTVYFKIKDYIKDLRVKYPTYKLRFVGHSLGGAMSSLAILKMREDLDLPFEWFELYSYGQPRTGNTIFAKWYNQQKFPIARVVNYNDLIPQLPSRSFDYAHHGTELFIDPTNTTSLLTYCSNSELEDPNCSNRFGFFELQENVHNSYFDQADYRTC